MANKKGVKPPTRSNLQVIEFNPSPQPPGFFHREGPICPNRSHFSQPRTQWRSLHKWWEGSPAPEGFTVKQQLFLSHPDPSRLNIALKIHRNSVSERCFHVFCSSKIPKANHNLSQPFPSLPIFGSRESHPSHPICGRKTRAKKPKR